MEERRQCRPDRQSLVHNHPTGEVRPSDEDKDITDHLIQVGRILDIQVVDHLIIAPGTLFSLEVGGPMEEFREGTKCVPSYQVAERMRAAAIDAMERGMRRGIREGKLDGLEEDKMEGKKKPSRWPGPC
uniref:RadC-like JAB domain-containing protein n=1 Tax=Candidatus Kentrum sp. LFY TaxID=2126342 RepID=A0A450U7T5_9GAMM|nr:MAG: RadC-like JAB domain-containing protein [Candidatus Kentron sp. LFY]